MYQMTNLKLIIPINLKSLQTHSFEFYKNGGKSSDGVENFVGKVEIAYYEKFLLFPQSLQKSCTADM